MNSVNVENAVMQERARIREEVMKLEGHSHPNESGGVFIPRYDVLKILSK